MTTFNRYKLKPFEWKDLSLISLPANGAIVGRWGVEVSDPFPELIVVREEDYADTFSWLSSFFNGLVPITQWCRIVHQGQLNKLRSIDDMPRVDGRLGAWVGAIVAECHAQANASVNLKELSGNAALSSATFAAARATALWGSNFDLKELAERHDLVSKNLRVGGRPISATDLLPIWDVLANSVSMRKVDGKALRPLTDVLNEAIHRVNEISLSDAVKGVIESASDIFDLPELRRCGEGGQKDRVEALDQLAEVLASGPKSVVVDALLGLGACFVDPGVAVMPDLLRKHTAKFPTSQIWLGVFAGALSPTRVLSEQNGLGRLISKSLLAPGDLNSRPSCDVSYEELSRWFSNEGKLNNINVRGMISRSLNVEVSLGVTCSFAYVRSDTVASKEVISRNTYEKTRRDNLASQHEFVSAQEFNHVINSLSQRIARLENNVDKARNVQFDMLEKLESVAAKKPARRKSTRTD
ncbi:hypothetical protein [Thalassospira xiamenensis]|uniref:hypothetical protein n=1 Tax=Thalassospira xiamenensis TaxID=220697 RepID=UPI0011BDB3FB|nr:hypothetical protein [Thalassospira xiamenensis]